MKKPAVLFFTFLFSFFIHCSAQVAINNTATNPDASAILDLNSGNAGVNKGFLAPQVALTDITIAAPVTNPATGLIVYSTSSPIGGNGTGYYYWSGSAWITLGASAPSSVSGSGISNYVARWTPNGNTLGTGLIQDDSNTVGVNAAPNGGYELFVYSAYPTGIAAFSFDTAVEGNTANTGVGVYGKGYYGIYGFSNYGSGVYGNGNANYGVEGTSGGGTGVYGHSPNVGVLGVGDNNMGVIGRSANGIGVQAIGNTYGLWGYCYSALGVGIYGYDDSNIAVLGYAPQGTGVYGWSVGNYGVYGLSSSATLAGVYGDDGNGYGVEGISSNGTGVYGSTNNVYGVQGISSDSVGVFGQGDKVCGVEGTSANGVGVYGTSFSGQGVLGNSYSGYGVWGFSTNSAGVFGNGGTNGVSGLSTNVLYAGVFGENDSNYGVEGYSAKHIGVYGNGDTGVEGYSANNIGVFGKTNNGCGVYGFSNGIYEGVYGANLNSYGTGVYGLSGGIGGVFSDTSGDIGYIADAHAPSGAYFKDQAGDHAYIAFAGYGILSNGVKSTEVKDENNRERVLFCNESPEVMFEDYGEGQLVNGKAHISLDPLFARNVAISEKHPLRVFIQLDDTTSKGVGVVNKTTNGFDVIDLAGKKCNTPFEWHIICNRANETGANRNYADKRFPVGPGPIENSEMPKQPARPNQSK